jgi:N-acetylneuraminic acid mutarotase
MPNTWANAEPMLFNTGTYGAYAAVANGKIYAVGRPDDTPGFLGQAPECIQVYDPSADSWAQKASMLPEYGFHAVASCQSKIYDFNAAQVYDITQDSWSPIPNMPAGIGIGVQPVTIGNSIYVIGGASGAWWGGNEIYNSAYMYDCLSNSWSEIASIPQEVAYYGAAAWDGKVYIIGGTTQEPHYGPIKPCNLVQIYNPQTNQWSQGAPMPTGLTYFSAAALNGTNQRIYVFGGYTEDASTVPYKYTSVATSQAYDPALNKWSTVKQLPAARYGASTVSLNGRIYVLGGSANSTNSSKDVQVYTPEDYVAPPNPTPTPTPAPTPTATLTPSLSPTLTPSPSVPEFPTWTIFPLVVAAILLAAFLKRKVKKI